ncbi:hypothetical protein BFW38_08440 [Terasakiispira papahanaumokuakeensis]|uniref:DUF1468 domain-containing protein n=1 Tax=Terasakiispira papahanaumokuakeensis TaxID=197479 RepID=A0A1E2V9N5_9GAMM|nr:tripartite tricarboxylate transporter TctB family protein [Terasakiispira papahanaumokuakeensis]ODC03572.1 hypothetical protein BFW38_08440 [Terasakiispira papahanaumokuakeensis]
MIRERLSPLSGHWLDRVLALAVVVLAATVLDMAEGFSESAAALPEIIGVLMVLCGLGLWCFPGRKSELSDVRGRGLLVALALFAITLALFSLVGADIGLWVMFIGCAWWMGYPLGLRLLVIALLFTALIGAVFGILLGVPLTGPVLGLLST